MPRLHRTKNEWIKKFHEIHKNNKYDYTELPITVNSKDKYTITCRTHKQFKQTLTAHANGQGCPQCAITKRQESQKTTFQDFKKKAEQTHDEKYEYSEKEYEDLNTATKIKCPEHGDFKLTPKRHLTGTGCPQCEKTESRFYKNTENFIKIAQQKHFNNYDYPNTIVKGKHSSIIIECPEHGEFKTTPFQHLKKKVGCPTCQLNTGGKTRNNSLKDFLFKANLKHNYKYDYSETDYKNSKTKITIKCPEHGLFQQRPNDHLTTNGCKQCGVNERINKVKLSENFVNKSNKVHSNKYDYSKIDYKNNRSLVTIICPSHGEFLQLPEVHLRGAGCQKCDNNSTSKQEKELVEFIETIYSGDITTNSRKILHSGKELDVYIPELKIAFEFNGVHWHSTDKVGDFYHYNKTIECEKSGVRLIHVWSDDWELKKDLIKFSIKELLTINDKSLIDIKEHVKEESTQLKLFFKEKLITVADFKKMKNSYKLEHSGYALTPLLDHFENNFDYDEITLRINKDSGLQETLINNNWIHIKMLPPNEQFVVDRGFKLRVKKVDETDRIIGTIHDSGSVEFNKVKRLSF